MVVSRDNFNRARSWKVPSALSNDQVASLYRAERSPAQREAWVLTGYDVRR
jgi:hypothetical protein